MPIVNVSYKGQIVIPAELRKKFGIKPHSKVEVTEFNNEIIVLPLLSDPIKQGRGFLKLKQPVSEIIREIKIEDRKFEDKKMRGFLNK